MHTNTANVTLSCSQIDQKCTQQTKSMFQFGKCTYSTYKEFRSKPIYLQSRDEKWSVLPLSPSLVCIGWYGHSSWLIPYKTGPNSVREEGQALQSNDDQVAVLLLLHLCTPYVTIHTHRYSASAITWNYRSSFLIPCHVLHPASIIAYRN